MKVDYVGICATDIEEYNFGPKFISHGSPNPITGRMIPLITGHEITGTVVETGSEVSNVAPGDRVVVDTIITCGTCDRCVSERTNQCESLAVAGFALDGGLAEYMVWDASAAVRLPDHVSSEEAALIEPSAVAHHAIRQCELNAGDTLAVLGAGTVGILAIQIAKAYGLRVFAIDRRQTGLDLAEELGADATINSEDVDAGQALRDLNDGIGPDAILDAAGGSQTPALAIDWVRRGGRVVLVAIYTDTPAFDFNSIVATEIGVIGSIANGRDDLIQAVRLLSAGKLKTAPLISDYVTLDQVVDVGFKRMMAPEKDVFRILVQPSQN